MIQVTPELVATILARYKVGEDISSSIVADIQRINRINLERSKIDRERRAEAERHADAVADLDRVYAALVASCHHPKTTFHPDPSGNNDSSRTCDLCGGDV